MSLIQNITKIQFTLPGPQDLVNALYFRMVFLQKRQEISRLLEQEDWLLKDMGLNRDDVRAALKHHGDPADYLDRCRSRTIRQERCKRG